MSIRSDIDYALKDAMKAQDKRTISTLRLAQAALKDLAIALRSEGRSDDLTEPEILNLLSHMMRQREESIKAYQAGKRDDLVQQEREEIEIIKKFMPEQLSLEAVEEICNQMIEELGAQGLKDMGRVMNELKTRYLGQMDFSKAGKRLREILSQPKEE